MTPEERMLAQALALSGNPAGMVMSPQTYEGIGANTVGASPLEALAKSITGGTSIGILRGPVKPLAEGVKGAAAGLRDQAGANSEAIRGPIASTMKDLLPAPVRRYLEQSVNPIYAEQSVPRYGASKLLGSDDEATIAIQNARLNRSSPGGPYEPAYYVTLDTTAINPAAAAHEIAHTIGNKVSLREGTAFRVGKHGLTKVSDPQAVFPRWGTTGQRKIAKYAEETAPALFQDPVPKGRLRQEGLTNFYAWRMLREDPRIQALLGGRKMTPEEFIEMADNFTSAPKEHRAYQQMYELFNPGPIGTQARANADALRSRIRKSLNSWLPR